MFQTGDTAVYFPREIFKTDSVAPDERTGEICYRLTPVYGDGCSVCLPESSPVPKEKLFLMPKRKTLSDSNETTAKNLFTFTKFLPKNIFYKKQLPPEKIFTSLLAI